MSCRSQVVEQDGNPVYRPYSPRLEVGWRKLTRLCNGGGFFDNSKVLAWRQADEQPRWWALSNAGCGASRRGGDQLFLISIPSGRVAALARFWLWVSLALVPEPSCRAFSAAAEGPRCRLALWRVELALQESGSRWSRNGCGRGESSRVREQGIQGGWTWMEIAAPPPAPAVSKWRDHRLWCL